MCGGKSVVVGGQLYTLSQIQLSPTNYCWGAYVWVFFASNYSFLWEPYQLPTITNTHSFITESEGDEATTLHYPEGE